MDERTEIQNYLKHRTERLKRKNPNRLENIMAHAKEEPSDKCVKQDHSYLFIATVDTKESPIYYFKCENCGDVVLTKKVRTEDDPMRFDM